MFEEYLQDSFEFLQIAQQASSEREARRYYRASAFYASGAIEAFVNYVADSFSKAGNLPPHTIAFLNDKVLIFSLRKVDVEEKTEFHRLDEKLRVLIRLFEPDFSFDNTAWSSLMQFKELRDSLVHPKESEDERTASDYDKELRGGIAGIIKIMNEVSLRIFGKPLRKQLLDLIPE
jgi:hypothetical protein